MIPPKTYKSKRKIPSTGRISTSSADSAPLLTVKRQYPNHYKMKKNRIIKLKQTKGKCEVCKRNAQVIHHIDESLDNHSVDNLLALCVICHKAIHHPDKVDAVFKTSKYLRLYGATMAQISKRTGFTTSKVCEMHYKGELKVYLNELITTAEFCLAKNNF